MLTWRTWPALLRYVKIPLRAVSVRMALSACNLLPVPESLVVRVEEQLVLDDVAAQRRAKLILVQKRLGNSVFVVEPVVRRQRVVAVIPVRRAMKLVACPKAC